MTALAAFCRALCARPEVWVVRDGQAEPEHMTLDAYVALPDYDSVLAFDTYAKAMQACERRLRWD